MITQSDNSLPIYSILGDKLYINFDERLNTVKNMDGTEHTSYVYNSCISSIYTSRDGLISNIIRSKYTIDDEIALINNEVDKPEDYSEYQAFRAQAKVLADDWFKYNS